MNSSELLLQDVQAKADRIRRMPPLMTLHEIKVFFEFIGKSPILRTILMELELERPDFAYWYKRIEDARRPVWPETEIGRIKLCLTFLQHCIDSEMIDEHIQIGFHINGSKTSSYDDNSRIFLDTYFDPFYEYLLHNIKEQGVILHILQRFKKRTEWFTRAALFQEYKTAIAAKKGEEILNLHLRKFLFDEGIENPFSEPDSPAGKADIIAGLETSDPLALEVKIYNPEAHYDKAYVKKGFNQALEYADDYNVSVCYLVIFNVITTELRFEFGHSSFPPYLEANNKRVYIISVHINPEEKSASKKKPDPFIITSKDLLGVEN